MAARHLQKLRAPQLAEPEDAEDADASEEETQSSSKAPFNPFDLLSDEEVMHRAPDMIQFMAMGPRDGPVLIPQWSTLKDDCQYSSFADARLTGTCFMMRVIETALVLVEVRL